jgi:arylsulfatase A-like enzyme
MPASRPNILCIVVDDCGYADLSCTGQPDYQTPALDRLAGEGIRFTRAYANSALCTNTRVALITGRYQYRLPIGLVEPLRWSDREAPEMGMPPGFPTLPTLLRGAGYRTALIGKWHLGYPPHYSPLKSGYDEFFGVMGGFTGYYTHIGDGGELDLYEGETPVERVGYVTDMLSERAAAWVAAAAARPEPYFLSLHYTAPHWPWSAPSVEAAARRREVERTELTEGGNTRIYGEMMQILDRGIGRVLDVVRQEPGSDNTLVGPRHRRARRLRRVFRARGPVSSRADDSALPDHGHLRRQAISRPGFRRIPMAPGSVIASEATTVPAASSVKPPARLDKPT